MRRMSPIGRAALEGREDVRLKAYQDTKGIWTIGCGHAATCGRAPIPVKGMTITAAKADELLAEDLAEVERALDKAITVATADHEFDALVSFGHNVGAHGAATSDAVKLLNAGRRDAAAAAMLNWRKPPEILDRRRGEMDQFITPYTVALPKARRSDKRPVAIVAPVPANDNSGFLAKVAGMFSRR